VAGTVLQLNANGTMMLCLDAQGPSTKLLVWYQMWDVKEK
jgi:hypothetical protein